MGEGYIYSDSCRNPVILVDQSAEPGNAEHLTGGAGQGWLGFRGLKRQPPMRSLLVVVADVLPEDSQEMSLAADEDVVRTLAPCGSHESFGDGVCRGRAYRRADDPHSFRAKHLIEGEGYKNSEVARSIAASARILVSQPSPRECRCCCRFSTLPFASFCVC